MAEDCAPVLKWCAVSLIVISWALCPGHASQLQHLPQPQLQEMPPLPHLQVMPALSPLAGKHLDDQAPGEDGQCARDTKLMEAAASNRTLWAIRMLDASAHVPSGVLWGLRYQMGSYDGCMASGASSPVGARYCLASLSRRSRSKSPEDSAGRALSAPSRIPWEIVEDLSPHQDAAEVLSGDGMARGSLPLGDVRVGLCVPRTCGAATLQNALQAQVALQTHSTSRSSFLVQVLPEHCHEHAPATHTLSTAATIFWGLLGGLTVVSIAAHTLGWTSWDWQRHVRSLSLPDPPLSGIDLSPLSGIRSINAIYLVGLHRGLHSGRVAFSNKEYFTSETRGRGAFAPLYRGVLGVDTFFFAAGLLLAMSRRGSFPKTFINRVVRMVPVYAIVVLFHCTVLPELGAGPLWNEVAQPMSDACKKWWWSNLLFLNNYVHGGTAEHMCMEHSWSLAVDMHMFIVSTFLLGWLPAGGAGLAMLAGLAALSTVPLALGTLLGGWPGTFPFTLRTLQGMWADPLLHQAYTPTHMRAAPYLVGLFAGKALPMLKDAGFRPCRGATLVLTLASLGGMAAVMCSSAQFNDLRVSFSPVSAALCAGLAPLAWAVALAVLVTVTVLGEPTVVHSLLSWQPLVSLSRLTYGVYLVSFPLQALLTAAKRDPVRITPLTILRDSLSDNVISFAISFWLFVVLEAPLRALAKRALSGQRSSTSTPTGKGDPNKETKMD